jgi:hypothetical protein
LHGITLVWLCVLLVLYEGLLPIEDGGAWSRPTLWLASMYGLMFGSETWLRMRGRMPQ